jgi:hypothetical protein
MAKQLKETIKTVDAGVPDPMFPQVNSQNECSPMSQVLTEDEINPPLGAGCPPAPLLVGSSSLPSLDPDISEVIGIGRQESVGGSPLNLSYSPQRDGGFVATVEGEYLAHPVAGMIKIVKKFKKMKAIVLDKRSALKELKRMVLPAMLKNNPDYPDFIRVRQVFVLDITPIPGTPDVALGKKMSDIPLMSFSQLVKLIGEHKLNIDPVLYGDDLLALRASIMDTLNSNPRMQAKRSVREESMIYQRRLREAQLRHANLLKF